MKLLTEQDGCWPTPQQELMLKAALWQGAPALAAWEEWQATTDFEQLDYGSFRLAPLLYHNLRAHQIEHPLLGRLKGIYRRAWYRNQLLFHHAGVLIERLHAAGVRTLVLKGAALSVLHYRDHGLRPMDDFDLLIDEAQADAAFAVLRELNWQPKIQPELLTEAYRAFSHSAAFKLASGGELDLHWRVFVRPLWTRQPQAQTDATLWERARPLQLGSVATLTLDPADLLLHICAHGAAWNPVPPLRWIADALYILRTTPDLDWERVLVQAEARRLGLALRETLRYLHQTLDAPLPPPLWPRLEQLSVGRLDRLAYQQLTVAPAAHGPLLQTLAVYRRYEGLWQSRNRLRTLIGLLRLSQRSRGEDQFWKVPFQAALRLSNKLAKWAWQQLKGLPSMLSNHSEPSEATKR